MTLLSLTLVIISTLTHAGWNMLARAQRTDGAFFLRVGLVTGAIGLGPALAAERWGTPFLTDVWGLVLLSGCFEAIYFLGLIQGYRQGDFSLVYPAARALPVLVLALVDVARGRPPSLLGWVGLGLVAVGCLLLPLPSLRAFSLAPYRQRVMGWVLVIAAGTVGYTAVDKIALEMLPHGLATAARYNVWVAAATLLPLSLLLRTAGLPPLSLQGTNWATWRWSIIAALCMTLTYTLILWAYQLSPYASYVVALRQFSIVIGVFVGARLFHEPAPALRFGAALVIVLGMGCLALEQ